MRSRSVILVFVVFHNLHLTTGSLGLPFHELDASGMRTLPRKGSAQPKSGRTHDGRGLPFTCRSTHIWGAAHDIHGGDPVKRPGIFESFKESFRLGLRTTVTPNATPLLTRDVVGTIRRTATSRKWLSRWMAPMRSGTKGFEVYLGPFHMAWRWHQRNAIANPIRLQAG